VGAALWAGHAIADTCPADKVQVLHCDIKPGKALKVCIGGGEASYEYGPIGKPELAMTQALGQVEGTPWAGVGRAIWEEIVFFNNDVSYAVWISIDRGVVPDPMKGGVLVTRGDQTLANLHCLDGTADVSTFAISDGFEQAGFCWDFDSQRFARECTN
jgi:hypothetical protein